jgi:hypothetical protein
MAIVDAATFKTQVATAAAALTTAIQDDTDTMVAREIFNRMTGLRQIEKLFNFDPATGVVSSDDTYIDACYAGAFPNKGTQFDVSAPSVAPAAVAAGSTVEDATPTTATLILTQDVRVEQAVLTDFTLGGTYAGAITAVTKGKSSLIFTLDTAVVFGDTLTIAYTRAGSSIINSRAIQLADFTATAITNNVAA